MTLLHDLTLRSVDSEADTQPPAPSLNWLTPVTMACRKKSREQNGGSVTDRLGSHRKALKENAPLAKKILNTSSEQPKTGVTTFFTGAPVNNKKKIQHPHETWCLRVALRLCGPVKTHQVFRHNRVVDGIMTIDEPASLWGPLGAFLGHREVLIEHYSDSVSQAEFCGCLEKIAFASSRYFSVPAKHRGEKRSPVMTILAHRRPDRLLRENGLFDELCPGIWVRRPLEMGAIYFVAATHLPPDPEFDWLRMTTRLPESREEILLVESLLKHRKIDKLTRSELEETMFELMIDGKTPKEAKAEVMALRSEALEAKEEAVELKSRLANALETLSDQKAVIEALQEESREREKLSLELAEMQRQLAEFKNSK